MKPSPGMMLQLWLQPPLSNAHKSRGEKERTNAPFVVFFIESTGQFQRYPLHHCFCMKKTLPQSFSSEPSGQSSVPSHSFSAGRQMESLVAHMWWVNLHTKASQLSSSELSSQSLSPSHTQALLMQRAVQNTTHQLSACGVKRFVPQYISDQQLNIDLQHCPHLSGNKTLHVSTEFKIKISSFKVNSGILNPKPFPSLFPRL